VVDLLPADERPYHVSSRIFEPLGIPYFRRRGEPRIRPRPDLERWARLLLRSQWGSNDDIIVGVSLEVTKAIKSWPAESFFTVVEKGIGDGLRFVLLGLDRTARDSPFAGLPKQQLLDLSERTRLAELIAIIDQCDLFLSCDAGPSHIAQACGVTSIVLFGPSNEMEFGPTDHELHTLVIPPEELPCRPCVLGPCVLPRTCMHSISPEAVYEALAARVSALREAASE
jgi:ADP-heptose:LPS heptosyltransferase